MSKRKYEPGAFVPCSSKHKHCSPAHSALVAGYREERERQEKLFEAETGNYAGDIEWHKENGHELITFKKWLCANVIDRQEQTTSYVADTKKDETPIANYTVMEQNQVDKIFNQIISPIAEEQNEEECNCDCDCCCRNDHIACCEYENPCCLGRP